MKVAAIAVPTTSRGANAILIGAASNAVGATTDDEFAGNRGREGGPMEFVDDGGWVHHNDSTAEVTH